MSKNANQPKTRSDREIVMGWEPWKRGDFSSYPEMQSKAVRGSENKDSKDKTERKSA